MSTERTGIFATKEYRFLCWLDAQQTATPEGPAIKMSQSAIAEAYGSSPATINGWIKSLKDSNCLTTYRKKSGYIVTETGKQAIKKMKELEGVIFQGDSRPSEPAPSSLSYIDVFSGCGGLSLGLGWAGWSGIFAIEKDPMAYSTFEHNLISETSPYSHFQNWPEWLTKESHDINDVLSDDTARAHLKELSGEVTLLAGGPPCQGFSVAGARNGNDPRNLLVFKQIEMARILRPRFVLVENVGGFGKKFVLRPSDNTTRSVAEEAVDKLKELGYSVGKITINAADFGVPQIRKRVILLAISEDYAGKLDVKSLLDDLLSSICIEQRKDLRLATSRYVNVAEALSDLSGDELVADPEFPRFKTCKYLPASTSYQKLMRKNIRKQAVPTCHRFNRHSDKLIALYNKAHMTQQPGRLSKEFLYANGCHSNKRFVLDLEKPCSTLTTAPEELIHFDKPRVVTLREMARLQSFPDDFQFYGRYTLNGPARGVDVPRNAQIGNAIPPLVGRALGLAIKDVISLVQTDDERLEQYRPSND